MLELQEVAHSLWDGSIARSTRSAYETGYRTYIHFLLMQGFVSMLLPHQAPPVSEHLLVLFPELTAKSVFYQIVHLWY